MLTPARTNYKAAEGHWPDARSGMARKAGASEWGLGASSEIPKAGRPRPARASATRTGRGRPRPASIPHPVEPLAAQPPRSQRSVTPAGAGTWETPRPPRPGGKDKTSTRAPIRSPARCGSWRTAPPAPVTDSAYRQDHRGQPGPPAPPVSLRRSRACRRLRSRRASPAAQ